MSAAEHASCTGSQRTRLFTIGFTRSMAEHFFARLQAAGVRRVLDVRLNNASQLAGFAKAADLPYFLRALGRIDYAHDTRLAPEKELLDAWRSRAIDWDEYERAFRDLMARRRIHELLVRSEVDGACLLCSEAGAGQCHRRLVAEHLAKHWTGVEIVHL